MRASLPWIQRPRRAASSSTVRVSRARRAYSVTPSQPAAQTATSAPTKRHPSPMEDRTERCLRAPLRRGDFGDAAATERRLLARALKTRRPSEVVDVFDHDVAARGVA